MGSHHWKSPISPHPASFFAIHQASFCLGSLLPPLSYRGSGPRRLTTLAPRRSELFLAFKRHPSKRQHVLATVLGNSLESPLSPSAPDSQVPSLVSGPTRCFTHQIPCLPPLPYFGVTSKLLPRDFFWSCMVFIFVNSFDLCLSVSDGSSFDGCGRGDDGPDLTLAGPSAHLALLPPAGVKVLSLHIYSFILEIVLSIDSGPGIATRQTLPPGSLSSGDK